MRRVWMQLERSSLIPPLPFFHKRKRRRRKRRRLELFFSIFSREKIIFPLVGQPSQLPERSDEFQHARRRPLGERGERDPSLEQLFKGPLKRKNWSSGALCHSFLPRQEGGLQLFSPSDMSEVMLLFLLFPLSG